jgi:hypothetical protein
MNTNKLLKRVEYFYSIASGKDLSAVLKELSELDTFSARKECAENNLERLSSGSSRIVYSTGEGTVIKLASNKKGIDQNGVEANIKGDSKFINKPTKHDRNNYWIEAPEAKKISEKMFEELTGIDFETFGEAIDYELRSISGNTNKEKPKGLDKAKKMGMFKELVKIAKDNDLLGGDISRISSFGERDGHPVLLDLGLNKTVFSKDYEDSSSSS